VVRATTETAIGRRVALVVAVVAAFGVLAIAGCGGGDDNSTSSSTPAGGAASTGGGGGGGAQSVDVSETEYKLDPSDPSVKAGSVTFNVNNDGAVTHNLEVEGPNGEQTLDSDLAPGDSGKLTVDLSKPGKYEFYCPIDSHKDMGMEGEITVQ
jgi:plastocyanin